MDSPDAPPSSANTSEDLHNAQQENVPGEKLVALEREPTHVKQFWKLRMRPADDDDTRDWWFACTAIPLLAATTGPLANVMSIAALVVPWRNNFNPAYPGEDPYSKGFDDPHWCIALNAVSLVCGFVGNIFLLFNFTRRVRYIVALPMTIILWYFATGILIGITVSMDRYVPPHRPEQTYSQGYWHAIIAAILYLVSSMMLMVNMMGYFLGHYPQHFDLTDEQRNLILQTMLFFIWLAGGAGVFSTVIGWSYVDALYFCDVTVLTVGFGDLYPTDDAGRGLVFPYSVGGIIMLGLMVGSIRRFAQELGHDKVIKNHFEKRRVRTVERSVSSSFELEERQAQLKRTLDHGHRPVISAPFDLKDRAITFDLDKAVEPKPKLKRLNHSHKPLKSGFKMLRRVGSRQPKILVLREEKDRFTAMRDIQHGTVKFKQYSALTMSIIAFGLLWCGGAVVFWQAEQGQQQMSYFEALYFCYVSLLTIGYGDLSPKSNAGKPFFIVWSLIAVPTMTILISDMGDTVIASFKRGTFTLADWTVLPKAGIWRAFLEKHPVLLRWLQNNENKAAARKRLTEGFRVGPEDGDEEEKNAMPPTLEELADGDGLDEHELARKLALAIRRTATDLKAEEPRRYSYEEWVEYTRLIRFSSKSKGEVEEEEEEEGLIEWDWIGIDSPMLAEQTESEWLLDRLCESLNRYMSRQVPDSVKVRRRSLVVSRRASKSGDGPVG